MKDTNILLGLPETEHAPQLAREPSDASGLLQHVVMLYDQIAAGRFVEIPVECDYLAIVSTFPVTVLADGVPLTGEDQNPLLSVAPFDNAGSWQPNLASSAQGGSAVRFRPGTSFVLRRRVHRLTVRVTGDVTDYENHWVPGDCHLFIGRGNVHEINWGIPVSFPVELTFAGGPVAVHTFSPIFPVLHGDNALSPSGFRHLPSRAELWGLTIVPTYTVAGVINYVRIGKLAEATLGTFRMSAYRPLTTNFELDFGMPIEVFPLQTRQPPGLGFFGALQVRVETSQTFTALECILRFRGWL